MSDIVERLNNASYANAPSRCMEAAREIERLRAIESAARDYYLGYVQDEADDLECCIVEEQHWRAKALRDALGEK